MWDVVSGQGTALCNRYNVTRYKQPHGLSFLHSKEGAVEVQTHSEGNRTPFEAMAIQPQLWVKQQCVLTMRAG